MTDADAQPGKAPHAPAASWPATMIARAAMRFSRYPARRMAGRLLGRGLRVPGLQRFTVTVPGTEDAHRRAAPVTLDALHLPAARPRRGPPIVMVHGWLEVKEVHTAHALRLAQAGHDVILFDHRGHGRSTGPCATFGVRERHDLQAVIDDAAARGILEDRVITLGYSLGAATVLQHAPMDRRVRRVVAVAPFVDFRTAIDSFRRRLARWVDHDWLEAGFERAAAEAGFTLDQSCTRTAMGEIDVPVLIVEGGEDRVLPPCDHIRPLTQARTHAPVQVLKVPGATHMSLSKDRWPAMERAVAVFCQDKPSRSRPGRNRDEARDGARGQPQ